MKKHARSASGFTLVELAVVMVVLGIIFAMSIPSFLSFQQGHLLQSAGQELLGDLRLGRQKALSMGHAQRLTFSSVNSTYTVQDLVTSQTFGPFGFARGIALVDASIVEGGLTGAAITALTDGRFSGSGEIVLSDLKGRRDTVSVQTSGLALRH